MNEQEIAANNMDACSKCPPEDKNRVTHFRIVGVERVEVDEATVERDHDCAACLMDEVIAVFGTDNLE